MAIKNNDSNDGLMVDVNLTPLIDIMLVLLLTFMVTSSISLESGLDINLPKTATQTAQKEMNVVIVSLDQQGKLFVQGQEISADLLQERIAKALRDEKTDEVIFEGDLNSSLGKMVDIMDTAKKAGAEKFSLATDSK